MSLPSGKCLLRVPDGLALLIKDGVRITLLFISFLILLKKFPCLWHLISPSITFISSSMHFSLSTLNACFTLLQTARYSFRFSTLRRCSCHLWKAMHFSSTSSRVSSEIHFFLATHLLQRCCSADPTSASFNSDHLSSTLPYLVRSLKDFLRASTYSSLISNFPSSAVSKHFPRPLAGPFLQFEA